jgi:hypothetical protein
VPASVLAIEATDQWEFAPAWPFRDPVNSALQKNGHELTLLDGSSAVQSNVKNYASDPAVGLVLGVGHGTPNTFEGYRKLEIFTIGYYDPMWIAGKIVHLTACETAEQLGPDFMTHGCAAFIGYDTLVAWDTDETAGLWFECDACFDLALAKGGSIADAHKAASNMFQQKIQQLEQANKPSSADLLATIFKHFCTPVTHPAFGDPSLTLTSIP